MAIEFTDKKLKCKEPGCGKEFVFTKGEQVFFLQKAYAEPARCPDCRMKRKKDRRKKRRELLRRLSVAEDVIVKEGTNKVQKETVSVGEAVKASINSGGTGAAIVPPVLPVNGIKEKKEKSKK